MLLTAYHLDRGTGYINVGALEAWYALAGATATALVGAALVCATMNKSRRHTFYAPKTIRQHVDEWHWETRGACPHVYQLRAALPARGEGQGVARRPLGCVGGGPARLVHGGVAAEGGQEPPGGVVSRGRTQPAGGRARGEGRAELEGNWSIGQLMTRFHFYIILVHAPCGC